MPNPVPSFRALFRFGCGLAACAAVLGGWALPAARAAPPPITVCFSPPQPGGCDPTATVVGSIAAARARIRVQIYALTARPIVAALIAAHRRGVDVRVIVDRSQLTEDQHDARAVARLVAADVPVLVDTVPGLMHDKIMLIDSRAVLTGSFNYTWSAEHKNAENLLVLRDPAVVAAYARNWRVAAARSRPPGASVRAAAPRRMTERGTGDAPPGPVRGNRRTMIYQWPACRYYDRIAPHNRVPFPSAAAARAAGYRAAHCGRF